MINNFSVIRIRSTRIYQSISQAAADRAKFNGFFFIYSLERSTPNNIESEHISDAINFEPDKKQKNVHV